MGSAPAWAVSQTDTLAEFGWQDRLEGGVEIQGWDGRFVSHPNVNKCLSIKVQGNFCLVEIDQFLKGIEARTEDFPGASLSNAARNIFAFFPGAERPVKNYFFNAFSPMAHKHPWRTLPGA